MRRAFQFVTLILFSLLLTACDRSDDPDPQEKSLQEISLKFSWYHSSEFLGFYVAQERGYYADEGLDVTIEQRQQTDSNILELVEEGKYTFSVGGSVYHSQAEGTQVTAIAAIYQFGPDAFFAQADSGIVSPADLKGRTIVQKSFGWQKMLEELLKQEGLTVEDVKLIEGGYNLTPFFNGEIEVWAGYLTDEVIRARHNGLELIVLPLHEYGITTVAQTITTSRKVLESNPELAVKFLRASLKGWKWAIEHPSEAIEIMVKRYPEMTEEREFHQAAFDASIPLVLPPGNQIGAIDCDAWLNDHDVLKDLESTEGLCTTEILETVWKDLGKEEF